MKIITIKDDLVGDLLKITDPNGNFFYDKEDKDYLQSLSIEDLREKKREILEYLSWERYKDSYYE